MNFDVDLPKCKKMLSEVVSGYFSVYQRVSMLRESINSSKNIQENNSFLVCSGVKCIQDTLYFSSITDIRAWFIDSDKKTASLHNLVQKLKNEQFSQYLEIWYSKPPSTIRLDGDSSTNYWHESYTKEKKEEFKSLRKYILGEYDSFIQSEITKRVATLRDKSVAHKEFKSNRLYDVLENGHQLSDAEDSLKMLDKLIFDLNKLINKSTYINKPSDFDKVSEQFWPALQST